MTRPQNVVDLPEGRPSSPGGGSNGGSGHGERLARIEAKMEHIATREDLAKVEVLIERKESTMLRWLLGILAVAGVSLIVALIRVFFGFPSS